LRDRGRAGMSTPHRVRPSLVAYWAQAEFCIRVRATKCWLPDEKSARSLL
jgi:hypothetical protein